jgi:ABC-2 type transport system ATP-binding protein
MATTAIKLTHITKQYIIHHEKPTLVEKIFRGRNETFWAIRDINIIIKNGERVGVIGPNGSGKTTLLKIIAGITTPTSGTAETKGKIVSLIDLEAGFHPDLTGEQNIYLNGMLLGISKTDIDKKIKAIIAFADIKQFIDTPLFTYSSGMTLRLGFAIAVHANPDILILDENLSTGDADFQKKSRAKLREFFHEGKTVIVVTHRLAFIRENCQRVIVLGHGSIIEDGSLKIIDAYESGKYT